MKPGIVVTSHIRYNECKECIQRLIAHVLEPRYIILFDNNGPNKVVLKRLAMAHSIDYRRMDDQVGGLTRTWNLGIQECLRQNCDTILLMNDDVLPDRTIRHLLKAASDPFTFAVYGPMADDPGFGAQRQTSKAPTDVILKVPEKYPPLNGFCMAFHADTLKRNMIDETHYFDPNIPWQGNEREWYERMHDKGGHGVVVGPCWVHHHKFQDWHSRLRD